MSEFYAKLVKDYLDNLKEDETHRPEYNWYPSCGYNACIVTWQGKLGINYRCICGLFGRFQKEGELIYLEHPEIKED